LVTSLLVASGVILGRFLARSRQAHPKDEPEEEEENERAHVTEKKALVTPSPQPSTERQSPAHPSPPSVLPSSQSSPTARSRTEFPHVSLLEQS
jgi:hypothetical protein